MPQSVIVIPCYNEKKRLDWGNFEKLLAADNLLLFVNDGSTDGTQAILESWQRANPNQVSVLQMPRNVGKGECVRQGLLSAMKTQAPIIGYVDADNATPWPEILRLIRALKESPAKIQAVMGSRIRRLGARITRHPVRHYLGRVFATAASLLLKIPVYDTQCGAKFFRNDELLARALSDPFHSRWIFDVELIGRLLQEIPNNLSEAPPIIEFPLDHWDGIQGSHINMFSSTSAFVDLLRISGHLNKDG